jgi:hypothetical protein
MVANPAQHRPFTTRHQKENNLPTHLQFPAVCPAFILAEKIKKIPNRDPLVCVRLALDDKTRLRFVLLHEILWCPVDLELAQQASNHQRPPLGPNRAEDFISQFSVRESLCDMRRKFAQGSSRTGFRNHATEVGIGLGVHAG